MSTNDIGIDPATPGDLPDLLRAFGQETYFRRQLTRQAEARGVLLVARQSTRVVGDVYLWLEPKEEPELEEAFPGVPLITHLEVVPDRRRRGIGSAIMGHIESRLTERGCKQVVLGLDPANAIARRFYETLGYLEWTQGALQTTKEIFLSSGGVRREEEVCHVFYKDLVSARLSVHAGDRP
ncbi:GNAT family N-acetyltransferase [Nonomuraea sp. NPDC050691]|uniref:GNAT family N-acetyltransferase n=1 Tax=Nonomuraea sp. NPDC050691 TaxID=3155661 RepID=UPI0033CA74AD